MKESNFKRPLLLIFGLVIAALLVLTPGVFAEETKAASAETAETAAASPIIEDPRDVTVAIPYAATFEVKVNEPEKYTYQWEYKDPDSEWRSLPGDKTDQPKLIYSATGRMLDGRTVRCVVTEKDNPENEYVSNEARLTLTGNGDAYIIAAGRGMAPGDNPLQFGDGTMSFEKQEDGYILTLDNVTITEKEISISDGEIQGCLNFNCLEDMPLTIKVLGKNELTTTVNSSVGNGINTMLYYRDPEDVEVTVTGGADDTLILKGGEIGFNVGGRSSGAKNCNLIMDANMELGRSEGQEDEWNTGIQCQDFTLNEGKTVKINRTNGGLMANGNINLKPGSQISAVFTPKPAKNGPVWPMAVYANGDITLDQANMSIKVDLAELRTGDGCSALTMGYRDRENDIWQDGHLNAKDSAIEIECTGTKGEAVSFIGIESTNEKGTDVLDNTSVKIEIDNAMGKNAGAYISGTDLTLKNGADLNAVAKGSGETAGVLVYKTLKVDDAAINTKVDALNKDIPSCALRAQDTKINLTNPAYKVEASATNGMAMGQFIEISENPVGYDPAYKASHIILSGKAKIQSGSDTVLSTSSLPNEEKYSVFETFYSKADTSVPVKDVTIGIDNPGPTPPTPGPTPEPTVNNGPSTGLQANGINSSALMAAGLSAAIVAVAVAYGIKRKRG